MASIDSYLRLRYPLEVVPRQRVLTSQRDSGGLPIRRLKHQTPVYIIRALAFHVTLAEADALDTFLRDHGDGADTFTLTDPDSGDTFTAITDPAAPWARRRVGPSLWEFDVAMIGIKA